VRAASLRLVAFFIEAWLCSEFFWDKFQTKCAACRFTKRKKKFRPKAKENVSRGV
jgi:hypothetical protein